MSAKHHSLSSPVYERPLCKAAGCQAVMNEMGNGFTFIKLVTPVGQDSLSV